MTRHTRNRQLQKLNSALAFKTTGCNIPIELSNKHVYFTDLDHSFQWCSPWKTDDEFGHFVIFDSREYGHFRVVDVK